MSGPRGAINVTDRVVIYAGQVCQQDLWNHTGVETMDTAMAGMDINEQRACVRQPC